jgi:hypothetical protein
MRASANSCRTSATAPPTRSLTCVEEGDAVLDGVMEDVGDGVAVTDGMTYKTIVRQHTGSSQRPIPVPGGPAFPGL